MKTSPFTAIDELLSDKGLKIIRNRCTPKGEIEWHGSDDEGMYGFEVTPELNEEEEATIELNIQSWLSRQLEILIENSLNEIESRIFAVESDKERESLCIFMTKRVEVTINRWRGDTASSNHPNTFILLEDFKKHLQSLSDIYSDKEECASSNVQQIKQVIQLPEGFSLFKSSIRADKLDNYQIALLFHYLGEEKVFINYSDKSLAQLAHILTGHSKQNIRTDEGFGSIEYIINDHQRCKNQHYKDTPNYNLLTVKCLLEVILEKINAQIEANNKKRNK